eukprot:1158400-Pelagomonas_calceolata.AAC.1
MKVYTYIGPWKCGRINLGQARATSARKQSMPQEEAQGILPRAVLPISFLSGRMSALSIKKYPVLTLHFASLPGTF